MSVVRPHHKINSLHGFKIGNLWEIKGTVSGGIRAKRKGAHGHFGRGQSDIYGEARPNERAPTARAAVAMVKFEA